jgi:hypothetical protein
MFVEAGRLHTAHSIYIKQHETLACRARRVDKVAPQYNASH